MCSSRGLCGENSRSSDRASGSEGSGSGAHYALCALGVGLIALGVVMIVWTVIPLDGESPGGPPSPPQGNSTTTSEEEDDEESTKSSTVAMVLVGVGLVLLVLSIGLGIRNKKRARSRATRRTAAAGATFMDHVAGEQEPAPDPNAFNVPSYEEVVGSGDYPVRQSNLTRSTSQLPSYEDIIAAVENEGAEPPTEETPLSQPAPQASPAAAAATAATAAAAEPEPDGGSNMAPRPSMPTRSASRASRLLRPLRVRRIKSDKLHLKDFRIQIRNPTHNPVTIEPITPPPQYDNEPPELG